MGRSLFVEEGQEVRWDVYYEEEKCTYDFEIEGLRYTLPLASWCILREICWNNLEKS